MSNIRWSRKLAYAVGLIATDGCLSCDGRHIDLTSKDLEQLENFKKCLGIKANITWKGSGFSKKRYPRIQFGDVKLFRWLEEIGIHPHKSKTIRELKIPDKYFFDFLRGCYDGDGSFYSYWDPRWKSSFMIYLQFTSASIDYLRWINKTLYQLCKTQGKIKMYERCYNLVFAKKSSKIIIQKMYANKNCICLSRKKDRIFKALDAAVLELADRLD